MANPAGVPYAIDFTLIDGSGTANGDNAATISAFTFGGGSPTGSASLTGGTIGSLSGSVSPVDSSSFNDFNQSSDAGSGLTFHVNLTTNVDSAPDTFSFTLLDNAGNTLATSDPLGGNAPFRVTIDVTTPTIETFSGLVDPPTIATRAPCRATSRPARRAGHRARRPADRCQDGF